MPGEYKDLVKHLEIYNPCAEGKKEIDYFIVFLNKLFAVLKNKEQKFLLEKNTDLLFQIKIYGNLVNSWNEDKILGLRSELQDQSRLDALTVIHQCSTNPEFNRLFPALGEDLRKIEMLEFRMRLQLSKRAAKHKETGNHSNKPLSSQEETTEQPTDKRSNDSPELVILSPKPRLKPLILEESDVDFLENQILMVENVSTEKSDATPETQDANSEALERFYKHAKENALSEAQNHIQQASHANRMGQITVELYHLDEVIHFFKNAYSLNESLAEHLKESKAFSPQSKVNELWISSNDKLKIDDLIRYWEGYRAKLSHILKTMPTPTALSPLKDPRVIQRPGITNTNVSLKDDSTKHSSIKEGSSKEDSSKEGSSEDGSSTGCFIEIVPQNEQKQKAEKVVQNGVKKLQEQSIEKPAEKFIDIEKELAGEVFYPDTFTHPPLIFSQSRASIGRQVKPSTIQRSSATPPGLPVPVVPTQRLPVAPGLQIQAMAPVQGSQALTQGSHLLAVQHALAVQGLPSHPPSHPLAIQGVQLQAFSIQTHAQAYAQSHAQALNIMQISQLSQQLMTPPPGMQQICHMLPQRMPMVQRSQSLNTTVLRAQAKQFQPTHLGLGQQGLQFIQAGQQLRQEGLPISYPISSPAQPQFISKYARTVSAPAPTHSFMLVPRTRFN